MDVHRQTEFSCKMNTSPAQRLLTYTNIVQPPPPPPHITSILPQLLVHNVHITQLHCTSHLRPPHKGQPHTYHQTLFTTPPLHHTRDRHTLPPNTIHLPLHHTREGHTLPPDSIPLPSPLPHSLHKRQTHTTTRLYSSPFP